MPVPFTDSKERRAAEQQLADGGLSIRLSRDTAKFWAQLIVMVLAISMWGFLIRADVQRQAEILQAAQAQQARQVDLLEKKIELTRYDLQQLQIALAAKGITTQKE